MHHLVYIGDRNRGYSSEAEEFLYDADFYQEHRITGALWFNSLHFVHLMEGEESDIAVTYSQITDSLSQCNVKLVCSEEIKGRFYKDWYIACFDEKTHSGYIAQQFGDSRTFEPALIPAERLINLLYFLEEERQHNATQAIG